MFVNISPKSVGSFCCSFQERLKEVAEQAEISSQHVDELQVIFKAYQYLKFSACIRTKRAEIIFV